MEFLEIRETGNREDAKYLRAKERLVEIKKFYSGLFSYAIVIAFLAALNYYTNSWQYMWFLWAALGWGIGLAFRAVKTYGSNPFFNKDWENRKIREFIEEDEQQNRWN